MAFLYALDRVELSNGARQTGAVLVRFLAGGSSWVGQRRLKAEWGIRPERLNRDVAELVAAGLLDVSHRRGERGLTIYRSRARYVDESNLIVLDDGRQLPARPTVGTLEAGSSDGSAPNGGRAAKKGSVPNSTVQRSQFDGPARPPLGTNHHTTRNVVKGGGGGRYAPEAAAPDGAASGEALEVSESELRFAFDLFDKRLASMGRKDKLARLNVRLRAAVLERLRGGWPPSSLVDVVCEQGFGASKVSNLEHFLAARLELLPLAPDGIYAEHVRPLLEAQQVWLDVFSWAEDHLWVSPAITEGSLAYQALDSVIERMSDGDAEHASGFLTEVCCRYLFGHDRDPTWKLMHAPTSPSQCRYEASRLVSFCSLVLELGGAAPDWQPLPDYYPPMRTVDDLRRAVEWLTNGRPNEEEMTDEPDDDDQPAPAPVPSYHVGDVVTHDRFGEGEVVSVSDDQRVVGVLFDGGVRRMSPGPLTKLTVVRSAACHE